MKKQTNAVIEALNSMFSAEGVSYAILLVMVFLAPLFIIPTGFVSFGMTKNLIIYSGVALSLIAFLVFLLKRGKIELPFEYVFGAIGVLPIIYLLAGLLSPSITTALWGNMVSTHTFVFLFIMMLLVTLTTFLFQDKNRIFYSYLLFFASVFLIAVYQALKLVIGGDVLSLGVLGTPTANLVGTWNDFGIIMSIITLLSLMTLEMLPMGRTFRFALYGTLAVSFIFLILVNYSLIWLLLSIFSLLFFVYIFSFDKSNTAMTEEEGGIMKRMKKNRSATYVLTLVILMGSVIFFTAGEFGSFIASFANTDQVYVIPTWQATFEVTSKTLLEDPVLGVGPNQFDYQWLKHKPTELNQGPFWHLEFNSGQGFIPTALTTAGLLGFLGWIVFLGLFLWTGFKVIFTHASGHASRYLTTSSFVIALFLWIVALFATPGAVVLMFTFFFTGLFFASGFEAGALKTRKFELFDKPRTSFVSVMVLVLLLIISSTFVYYSGRSVAAEAYFQKGVEIFNTVGNLNKAEQSVIRAASIRPNDLYYRTLVELNQIELNRVLSLTQEEVTLEEAQRELQFVLSKAGRNASLAIDYDRSDYRNWMALGQINHNLVQFGVEGSYEKAVEMYEEAHKRNPTSPGLLLTRAHLERAHGENTRAREYIAKSLALKPDYTDARFLLAQIAIQENNVPQALTSLNTATVVDPNNAGLFFQLGLLYYDTEDWQNAVGAFERALGLTGGSFANAQYFLGLSHAELGNRSDAIEQFEVLVEANPDNQEVATVLSNLKLGRRALYGIEQAPIEREDLPVDEEGAEDEGLEIEDETATSTDEGVE